MTPAALQVERPLLVVACPWCGRVWGRLSPGTVYQGVKCPQRGCGIELSGTVGVELRGTA